jgi:hypothetical protein
MEHGEWPSPGNIAEFTYSKLAHFDLFRGLPFQSFNVGDPDPAVCDLKVYQDYLTYCFIRNNIPRGSKILEVGGGDSRILKYFSSEHECWNIDKYEGLGNGPVGFTSPDYKIVYDFIGSFNPALPGGHFDLVFSISALEHTPDDSLVRSALAEDIERVLKPGGFSFHCLDIVLRPGSGRHWYNTLISYFYEVREVLNPLVGPAEVLSDPRTYFMSEAAYDASWKTILQAPYEAFGLPASYNLLWRKP